MKRTIKSTAVILLVVIFCGLLTGCGKQNNASNLTISDMENALGTHFDRQETDGKIAFSNSRISGIATKKEKIVSVDYHITIKDSMRRYYDNLYSISNFKAEMDIYTSLPYDWLNFNLEILSCVPFMRCLADKPDNSDDFFGLDTVINAKQTPQDLNGWTIKTTLDNNTITISAVYSG